MKNPEAPKLSKSKIAGVSYDNWLEDRAKEPFAIKDQKKYSNKLIAFLDILGIKNLINETRNGKEYIAIDKIETIRRIVQSSTQIVKQNNNIEYLQISDSFVFVCDPNLIIPLMNLLSTIQMRILNECQFLLRGAVTIGHAITRDEGKFIVGPAYIKAFQLQENDAIYPRIIVDKSGVTAIKRTSNVPDYLQQDKDKEYFIDYLKVYMVNESLSKQEIKIKFRREDICNCLSNNFDTNYKDENHNICQKYGWTIQYFKNLGVWQDE